MSSVSDRLSLYSSNSVSSAGWHPVNSRGSINTIAMVGYNCVISYSINNVISN